MKNESQHNLKIIIDNKTIIGLFVGVLCSLGGAGYGLIRLGGYIGKRNNILSNVEREFEVLRKMPHNIEMLNKNMEIF